MSMPEGPLGAPRPFASNGLVIYSRFRLGGGISGDDTENLQYDKEHPNKVARLLKSELELDNVEIDEIKFHPAGHIVGVEVRTTLNSMGKDTIEGIVDTSQEYLESVYDVSATLKKPSRTEPAVIVRTK